MFKQIVRSLLLVTTLLLSLTMATEALKARPACSCLSWGCQGGDCDPIMTDWCGVMNGGDCAWMVIYCHDEFGELVGTIFCY